MGGLKCQPQPEIDQFRAIVYPDIYILWFCTTWWWIDSASIRSSTFQPFCGI